MKKTLLFITLLLFAYCKKASVEDKSIYMESSASGLFEFSNGDLLSPAGSSPHGPFTLKFNSIAQAALDSAGKLPIGGEFPDGSLLVKESFSGSNLDLIIVMKKDLSSSNTNKDWLWSEYKPDGSVVIGVEEKGSSCISCHSAADNRDYTLTFGLH